MITEQNHEIIDALFEATPQELWVSEDFYEEVKVKPADLTRILEYDNDIIKVKIDIKYDKVWKTTGYYQIPSKPNEWITIKPGNAKVRSVAILAILINLIKSLEKDFKTLPAMVKTCLDPLSKYYDAYDEWFHATCDNTPRPTTPKKELLPAKEEKVKDTDHVLSSKIFSEVIQDKVKSIYMYETEVLPFIQNGKQNDYINVEFKNNVQFACAYCNDRISGNINLRHNESGLFYIYCPECITGFEPYQDNKSVVEPQSSQTIYCEVGKHNVGLHPQNPNLFNVFRDADTNTIVCASCKDVHYARKNKGKYGKEHKGKYNEVPIPVPVDITPSETAVPAADETDDEFLESLDKVVTWVDTFGYNDCGVCVSGEIEFFNQRVKKAYVNCSVAKTNKGWSYGLNIGSKYTLTGCGGGGHGISINPQKQYQFNNMVDAQIAVLNYCLKDQLKCANNFKGNPIGVVHKKLAAIIKTEIEKLTTAATPKKVVEYRNKKKGLSALIDQPINGLEKLLSSLETTPIEALPAVELNTDPTTPKVEVPAKVKSINESYPGGKNASGTPQFLINTIPPVDCIVSGFLGHCAVLKNIRPAKLMVGMDIDKKVIDRWNKERPNIKLINDDFLKQTSWINPKEFGKTLLFLDPPYLMETRSSQVKLYDYEFDSEDQHRQLLEKAVKMPCYVMITAYENELYDSILLKKGFRKIKFSGQTRAGRVEECLYLNFDQPEELHDYSFVGNDYRERWNNKKIVNRTIKQLQSMPALRRNMILHNIQQHFKTL